MGRRKIEIKAIKDDRNRSVTFLKRKGGLFKKAHELSVLCSVDVAVIIFGHNKKLYEFSSGDINETIGRYQYYGQPHEHKGPADFAGKRDLDDDDDEDMSPPPEDLQPQNPHMVPPHLDPRSGFQYMRTQAPSASPPIANGMPFHPRHGTPQPQVGSRPSSRNNVRRMSSNLAPQQHPHATPPPPTQNGFAYMPNPPIYNPQANPNMAHQPTPPTQFQQFPHHPPPPPPPQHSQVQQAQQQYLQEQRRQSLPPQPQFQQQERPQPPPEQSPPQPPPQPKPAESQPPPQSKHQPSKSRSIFTPIDDRGSVLAQHWGFGSDPPRSDAPMKPERPSSVDHSAVQRTSGPPAAAIRAISHPQRTQSMNSLPDIPPPSRTNSAKMGAARPRLKVQIPSENSDGGSATAESSPRDSGGNTTATPAKGSSDTNHSSGVVLPPPSPSASALLSAGAQGPPNPFARPPPPGATSTQNTSAYNSNNNIETPISALPSRFVADGLLPSPSSFYPEWGFGRSGPDSNMLPSPLTFPTPVMQTGPGFPREMEDIEKKRKSPEGPTEGVGPGKRLKT